MNCKAITVILIKQLTTLVEETERLLKPSSIFQGQLIF